MIVSRGFGALKVLRNGLNKNRVLPSVRHSGDFWVYRTAAKPASKNVMIITNVVGAFGWWWILWHIWHEPEHITGEFEYPDPSKWTDAELGIPPDDTDEIGHLES